MKRCQVEALCLIGTAIGMAIHVALLQTRLYDVLLLSISGRCCSQGSATAGGPHDRENAHALSNALMVMTIIPWAFCCICYSGLHFTYPKVTNLHGHTVA